MLNNFAKPRRKFIITDSSPPKSAVPAIPAARPRRKFIITDASPPKSAVSATRPRRKFIITDV